MADSDAFLVSAYRNERFRLFLMDFWNCRELFCPLLQRDLCARYEL